MAKKVLFASPPRKKPLSLLGVEVSPGRLGKNTRSPVVCSLSTGHNSHKHQIVSLCDITISCLGKMAKKCGVTI